METILRIGEKIFKKYIWIVSICYVIGYILVRIQYAQYGISEVQIFKERYLLTSIMFLLYCLPPILFLEGFLKYKRKEKEKNKIDTFLLTIMLSILTSFFVSILPAIIYNDSNYENMAFEVALISLICDLFIIMIFGIFFKKLKNRREVVNSVCIIVVIILFTGLSISQYRNFKPKEDWLNMYITSFFIIQVILFIRLLAEKYYINKQNNIPINKKCERVQLATLVITLLLYGNFVFKTLPLELGGGKLIRIEVETENQLLLKQIQNKNVYLLDRSGDTYILIIEQDENEDLYKTIEIAKDQAVISIPRKVKMKYFK